MYCVLTGRVLYLQALLPESKFSLTTSAFTIKLFVITGKLLTSMVSFLTHAKYACAHTPLSWQAFFQILDI